VKQPHADEVIEGPRLLQDFFHSFAISSALFLESLFAIDAAGTIVSWENWWWLQKAGMARMESSEVKVG